MGVSRMMALMMRRARCHRSGPRSIRVQVTEAPIAGDHVRHAGFHGLVLAIPIDLTIAERDDGAPRGVTEGMTHRNVSAHRCREGGHCDYRFGECFHANTLGCRHRKSNEPCSKAMTAPADCSR